MATAATISGRHLDYPEKIHVYIEETEKHLALCDSPKQTEFGFCALLAAWEATTLRDCAASQWTEIWRKQCRKRHHGKTGRTLGDPVNGKLVTERWRISRDEAAKAYAKV